MTESLGISARRLSTCHIFNAGWSIILLSLAAKRGTKMIYYLRGVIIPSDKEGIMVNIRLCYKNFLREIRVISWELEIISWIYPAVVQPIDQVFNFSK
jgi:hypothetical protein